MTGRVAPRAAGRQRVAGRVLAPVPVAGAVAVALAVAATTGAVGAAWLLMAAASAFALSGSA